MPSDLERLLDLFLTVKSCDNSALANPLARQRQLRKEQENLHWFGELLTQNLDAYVYPADNETGEHRLAGYDHTGRRFEGSGCFVDPQSDVSSKSMAEGRGAESGPSRDCEPGELARDETRVSTERIGDLQEWVVLDNDAAAEFIVNQLERTDLAYDWLVAVVYAAEDVRFPDEEQRERACSRLRELATALRLRTESDVEEVTWSALRRFASLVREEDADQLTDFLSPGVVDTRLVALQCIVNIFEVVPPTDKPTIQRLSDRVFELAGRLLVKDVLVAGETSAIAELSVQALAAMGDHRLGQCIEMVRDLGFDWFTQIVQSDLLALVQSWSDNGVDRRHPVVQQTEEALRAWEQSA